MSYSLIFTCEHASIHVPSEYQYLFNGHADVLGSHQGWDPGAGEMATTLAHYFNVPLLCCSTTRLLVEANRTGTSPQLFSEFSNVLSLKEKEQIKEEIYWPYRNSVQWLIETLNKPVLHISMHSFTPVWKGEKRKTDIGILFDPSRKSELYFSEVFAQYLIKELPAFQIDFNMPYLGTDDGFTTELRTLFKDGDYAGIEIEVNQKFIHDLHPIVEALKVSLAKFLEVT